MTERLPSPQRPNARQRDSTYQTGGAVQTNETTSYVAIAEAREVKVVTIRNAIYTIQVKLGVASKQEIVVWAVRNGLLDD